MSDADRYIVVFRAAHTVEANLLKGLLESHGIPVRLTGESLSSILGGIPVIGEVRVTVPQAQRMAAERVLRVYEPGAAPSGTPWTCTQCNEPNDASFEVCWNCARPAES